MRSNKERRRERARAIGRIRKKTAAPKEPPALSDTLIVPPPSSQVTSQSTQTPTLREQGYWQMSDAVKDLRRSHKDNISMSEQLSTSFWSSIAQGELGALALPLPVHTVHQGASDVGLGVPHEVSSVSVSAETSLPNVCVNTSALPMQSQLTNGTHHHISDPVAVALHNIANANNAIRCYMEANVSPMERNILIPLSDYFKHIHYELLKVQSIQQQYTANDDLQLYSNHYFSNSIF